MKRIFFSIFGSMLISLIAVQAQQRYDTTGTAKQQGREKYNQSEQDNRSRQPGQRQGDQAWQQQSDRDGYTNEGMVIIDKDEIPSALRQKLQEDKYSGWENATIYHNTNTGEYVIAPRAYRFDEDGKEVEIDSYGYGSRDSRYSSDQNNETTISSSRDQSDATRQSSERQQQSYDQPSQGQQRTGDQSTDDQQRIDDQATGNRQQRTYDQSTQTQQETDDQSSQSREQSNAYKSDRSQQDQDNKQQSPGDYSTDQNDQSNTYRQDESPPSSQDRYRTEDMVEIQAEQIPASLRRTLSERQYSGWEENGKLYQDPATNEYVLVMERSGDASQSRTYRFDKNGKIQDDGEQVQSEKQ